MPRSDTQFKKGNPGGPGRPKGITAKERVEKILGRKLNSAMSSKSFRESVALLLTMSIKELSHTAANEDTPAFIQHMARFLIKHYKNEGGKSSLSELNKLVEIAFGKPRQKADITSNGETIKSTINLSDGSKIEL